MGTNYTYDQAGCLTNKTKGTDTTTYSYDLFDQLTGVEDSTQGTTTYTHDALGRRSTRTDQDSEGTAHYGDLTDIPIFDTGAGGEVTRSFIEGPEGLIEERSQGDTTYPLPDAHGDITAVTDQSGQLTSSHSYSPWGEDQSSTKLQMGYLGAYLRRTDIDTGLTQMGVRQYAPSHGRFTSEDPVLGVYGFGQSLNRHAYAVDNPLRFLDLDGQSIFDSTFWNEWIAPIGGTAKSMASPWTGEVFEDYEMGMRSMPRSLQKFDKMILEYGPWLIPYGGVFKLGKLSELAVGGKFTGYTRHGLARAISKDGVGVSPQSILNALKKPVKVVKRPNETRYIGDNAVVVLNKEGKVITTWPTTKQGYRLKY